MPQEIRHERQLRPQPAAARPYASPESYGAGLGRAVEGVGDAIHRHEIVGRQIERAATRTAETTEWSRRFATYRETISMRLREMRDQAAAGGAGHGEMVREALNTEREQLLDGFTEDSVRAMAEQQLETWSASVQINEDDWQDVQRVKRTVEDWAETRSISANRSRRLDNLDDFTTEMELLREQRELLDLNEDQQTALGREDEQALTIGFLQGQIARDPALAKAMLDSPIFDDVLDPGEVEALLNGSEVEIRRIEAARARQAAEAKAAFNEVFDTAKIEWGNGTVIADETLTSLAQQAAAFGDTSKVAEIRGMIDDNSFAKIWGNGNATPLMREQELNRLAQKGEARTDPENRLFKYLTEKSSGMDSAFEGDKVRAILSQSGGPALNLADPASIKERTQWARAQSRATGRTIPIATKAELAPLRDMLAKDGGAFAVLDVLDQVPDPMIRVETAKLIAPADPLFHSLALIEPEYRETIRRGQQAVKANTKLLSPTDKFSDEAVQLAAMERDLNRALVFVEPGERAAILSVAKSYLAGRLDEYGMNVEQVTPEMVQRALTIATGGEYVTRGSKTVRVGGLGTWGDRAVWIAEGMTEAEFTRALWDNVAAADKIGLGPISRADGSKAKIGRATPVWVGPGRYQWHDAAGNELVTKEDVPFVSELGFR